MERQNWIDWAKAIGIYLMVVGHCEFKNNDIIGFIYTFHMPFFFMISSYLFNDNLPTFTKFITKLKDRLLMPYILTNLIVIGYESLKLLIKGTFEYTPTTEKFTFGTLLGIPGNISNGPTWFLLSLFWCQLFMFAYIKLKQKGLPYYLLLVIPVIIFLSDNYQLYYCLKTIPFALLYFLIMYHSKDIVSRIFKIGVGTYKSFFISILLFVITFIIYKLNGKSDLLWSLSGEIIPLGILGGITGTLALFFLGYALNKFNIKLIKTISSSTILILGFHITIMNFINLHICRFQGNVILNFIISLIITIVISLAFPLVTKYFPILTGNRK